MSFSLSGNNGREDFFRVNVHVMFVLWWVAWGVAQSVMLMYFGVDEKTAATDSVMSTLLLAALCIFIYSNLRYYLPKGEKYLYTVIVSLVLSAIWLLLSNLLLHYIYKNNPAYLQFLQHSLVIRYETGFFLIACNTLVALLRYTQKEQQQENSRKADMERLAREAELNKLRQQLQPHFLFNSLNSISALTGQEPERARHMIQQLSDFLRGTLRNEGEVAVTLRDEIEYLQLYLDIEKVRFGYRLQSSIHCEEAALSMKIPSMLLQPLVENAIKFGLYDTVGEVEIVVRAHNNNGMLEVCVQNPFDEATAMPLKGTGFGIASIRRRLYLLFGRTDLLEIAKTENIFKVTIKLPGNSDQ